MKKIIHVAKNELKKNNKIALLIGILIIVGFIAGTLFITILDQADKEIVLTSITDLFEKIKAREINYFYTLRTSIIANLFYVTAIYILGISIIGIPIVMVMTFFKAFILGFSISAIIYSYQLAGTVLSFVYTFPHQLLNVAIVGFMSIYSIKVSITLFSLIFSKKSINFKLIMKKYFVIFVTCVVLSIISSLLEAFFTPNFINLFSFLFN